MTYKWHIVGGIIAYSIGLLGISFISPLISSSSALLWLFFCLLGALFPDIDTKSKARSLIYNKWFFVLFVILIIMLKTNFVTSMLLIFCALLPFIAKHRGFFHNSVLLIGIPITVATFTSWYWPAHAYMIITCTLFFIAGALSHLTLDNL